jgi:hypothetical protein
VSAYILCERQSLDCLLHNQWQGRRRARPWKGAAMAKDETGNQESASLFHIIVTDIHFWIPLLVFVAGLVLLHELG